MYIRKIYPVLSAEHLWEDPTHREVWVALSHKEEDLYSRFNYFLETDATLHLDDALKLLQEIKVFERLPPEQQTAEERQGEHERQGKFFSTKHL